MHGADPDLMMEGSGLPGTSGLPIWTEAAVVGAIVFASSGVAGLTSFGDAITMLAILGLLRVVGVYKEDTAVSVFNITLMTGVTLPYMAWEMRDGPLRARLRDGLLLSTTGLGTVFIGFWLLHVVDTTVLGYIIGTLFFVFSSVKLTIEIINWRLDEPQADGTDGATEQERQASEEPDEACPPPKDLDDARPTTKSSLPNGDSFKYSNYGAVESPPTSDLKQAASRAGTADGKAAPSAQAANAARSPGEHSLEIEGDEAAWSAQPARDPAPGEDAKPLPYHWSIGDEYVPPPWPTCVPPFWRAPVVVLISGLGAGVLGGMLGVHGPPIVVGFSLLRLGKDETRATFVVYALLELVLRLALFANQGIAWERWPVYATVCVVSLGSFLLGTWLRKGLDGPTVMRCLLAVVLLGACLQLGVTEHVESAAVVLPLVAVWGVVMWYWASWGYTQDWWICTAVFGVSPGHAGTELGAESACLLSKGPAASSSAAALRRTDSGTKDERNDAMHVQLATPQGGSGSHTRYGSA